MIQLKNISHFYGSKTALQNISLDIESDRITCLLGSSGCGKTSILRIIAGLENPTHGQLIIGGNTLSADGKIIIPPQNRGIGFIFQDLALWPHFTVFDNIAFGLQERKESNVEETVLKMLDFFDLSSHVDKFPHQLSGGQKQLVAISRALVLKPKILLMDEPLANIDVKLKRRILEHIKSMKKNFSLSIVYVTHDHREAIAIADQIIVLNEGELEAVGSVDDIKKSENEFVKYFLEY